MTIPIDIDGAREAALSCIKAICFLTNNVVGYWCPCQQPGSTDRDVKKFQTEASSAYEQLAWAYQEARKALSEELIRAIIHGRGGNASAIHFHGQTFRTWHEVVLNSTSEVLSISLSTMETCGKIPYEVDTEQFWLKSNEIWAAFGTLGRRQYWQRNVNLLARYGDTLDFQEARVQIDLESAAAAKELQAGAGGTETADNDSVWVLISKLQPPRFSSIKQRGRYIEKHSDEIRSRHAKTKAGTDHPKRREVHLGDWIKHWDKVDGQTFDNLDSDNPPPLTSDNLAEDFMDGAATLYRDVFRGKRPRE
jgi:hypothetical protein